MSKKREMYPTRTRRSRLGPAGGDAQAAPLCCVFDDEPMLRKVMTDETESANDNDTGRPTAGPGLMASAGASEHDAEPEGEAHGPKPQ